MKPILNLMLRTEKDVSLFFLRLVLGGVFFAHGAQKLFGWFGGYGYAGTMQHFTESMGIPAVFAFLAIMAESIGAIALIAGFGTRIAALGIGTVMAVAVCMVHLEHGFFMNWSGSQSGEGFEYHLLALGMALALMIKGGGALSVDGALSAWLKRNTGPSPTEAAEIQLKPGQT